MTNLLSLNDIRRLDEACKEKGQFIGRFVSNGFTDRTSIYIVVDETKMKYRLKFIWGESPNPDWGHDVKISKKVIEDSIKGRDHIKTIFPPRN